MNSVSKVVSQDLCISCGTCQEICPKSAITLTLREGSFRANVDQESCIKCGLCLKVCPSYEIDLSHYTAETLFRGSYRSCYIAQSRDPQTLLNGSSGGVVTSAILRLLEEGFYKSAAVVAYNNFDGENQAKYRVTKERVEIISAAKSKYIPVSVAPLLEYLEGGDYEPIVVVALPCQISAIKSYCKLKRIEDRNILFLGLFCEHTLNYNIYNYYSYLCGEYDEFFFRSKYERGWPGHTVITRGKRKIIIDRKVRMSLKPLFKNNRCRFCIDKLNRLADISFGDCYIKGEESFEGRSSIVIRSEVGAHAFEQIREGLSLQEGSFEDIIVSQGSNGLEINLARAQQVPNNIYINAPFRSDLKIDLEEEKRVYATLRVGAVASRRKDYRRIYKDLNGRYRSRWSNLKEGVKNIFKKKLLL